MPTAAPVFRANVSAPAKRASAAARGYGRAWDRKAKRLLDTEPMCRQCRSEGRLTAATDVDHIVAKSMGGSDDESNLQPLCKRCHYEKTGRERKGAGENGHAHRVAPFRPAEGDGGQKS